MLMPRFARNDGWVHYGIEMEYEDMTLITSTPSP
jgi:hypothetical protein